MSTPKLQVGDPAPALEVIDDSGQSISLTAIYGKGPVLIFFFPKSDTPGCTKEACGIRDHWHQFQTKGLQVLGVSTDLPAAQRKFREKYQLPFRLISDPMGSLIEAFGVTRRPSGNASRESFLIVDGKIAWQNPKVNPEIHAQEVLEVVDQLVSSASRQAGPAPT
ncbi:peroxiredoxin [Candidatus Methylacidithermus pantelleriae]|uniref:thioredoxin-dependent peroxiredoxin n=1 Tax=Candidatus Methylacidithermus pantelleriae TaxID=2744239 RepID=A0A8J2BLI4_9BACT|nr:peroxiredoxin [Candidatus Methylacidithermus pantelleriae]CAF0705038.1 Putative peroxiredoxin bcp [Candidatus Methylacidithermus pantelleriae]